MKNLTRGLPNNNVMDKATPVHTTQVQEKITWSDLHAHEGAALVAPKVIYRVGVPESDIVAGLKVKDSSAQDGFQYFTIQYHNGRRSWMFCDEWANTPNMRHQMTSLEDAVARFEEKTGVNLPPITVIDPGVGVWIASNPNEKTNPWKLEAGKQYRCYNPDKRLKEFTVVNTDNGLKLTNIQGSDDPFEERDPRLYLNSWNWENIREISDDHPNGKLLFDHTDLTLMQSLIQELGQATNRIIPRGHQSPTP